MSKNITQYRDKSIDMGIYGFFIQYNSSSDFLIIDTITSPEELMQSKRLICPFINIVGDIVYNYTISTQHLLAPNGFRRRYITRRNFEKWLEQPFRNRKLVNIWNRIIDMAESYFNWDLKIEFEDV